MIENQRLLVSATDYGFLAMATADATGRESWQEGAAGRRLITSVTFGWASPQHAIENLEGIEEIVKLQGGAEPRGVEKQWVKRLINFMTGRLETLWTLPVDVTDYTPFQKRVAEACRAIPYGETRTYADLAEAAGSPRAARAVGNVMRTNRYPLILPCHRVVGSGGSLGGYSAREGLTTKQRLLEMEASLGVKKSKARVTAGA